MYIGYARISTQDQNDSLQTGALKLAGCGKIFSGKVSGSISERPGLTKLKEQLRNGDTLVIGRLNRLAKSLKDLIEWVAYLEKEWIALKSIKEIDT
jgi:DNA invertase Pin-like site-specific DNA recombinase